MPDGFYVAMSAATARTRQLDNVADALANAQTPGYRADGGAFEALMGPGGGADPSLAYVATVATGVDVRPGVNTQTGRPLDVVPQDGAYLGVRLPDGSVGFTRGGRLSVDAHGVMHAGDRPVLNAAMQPLAIPRGANPLIAADGSVLVNGKAVDALAAFHLEGPLTRVGKSTVMAQGSQVSSVVPQLALGQLEFGRASALDATVQMVVVQRQFENAMQALAAYKKLDQSAVDLGRVR